MGMTLALKAEYACWWQGLESVSSLLFLIPTWSLATRLSRLKDSRWSRTKLKTDGNYIGLRGSALDLQLFMITWKCRSAVCICLWQSPAFSPVCCFVLGNTGGKREQACTGKTASKPVIRRRKCMCFQILLE